MKTTRLLLIALCTLIGTTASAQEMTALSCDDFQPTPKALERFPNLEGACEGIVERDGELFGLFTAVVRRVTAGSVTLHLPATGKTFTVRPESSSRVLLDGKKARTRDLIRGQEISIYLAVNEFAKPDIQEVAFVTETETLVQLEVQEVAALPTTASVWPTIAGAGVLMLGVGLLLGQRRRRAAGSTLAVAISLSCIAAAPGADAQTKTIEVPKRVVTSVVKTAVIVEAVNKETREIKVIDASGRRYSFIASDMIANFDQIEPRDRIVTEYLESIAIIVVPEGMPAMGDAAAVELAPLGGRPGVAAVDTFMVSARIESLNVTDRMATLRTEDGEVRTVKVADNVPLDKVDVGDEVRMRVTQAMAISVREVDNR